MAELHQDDDGLRINVTLPDGVDAKRLASDMQRYLTMNGYSFGFDRPMSSRYRIAQTVRRYLSEVAFEVLTVGGVVLAMNADSDLVTGAGIALAVIGIRHIARQEARRG